MQEFGVLMKYIRLQQLSVGCWPLEEVDGIKNTYYKVFQWISAFLYSLKIVLEFSYICLHTGNVYALGKMFIIFLSGLLYQVRMMNIMLRMPGYSDVIVTFRDQINLLEFRKPTVFSKKITEEREKECKLMLAAFTIMFWGGHTLFYLISLFVNYKNGAFKRGSDVPRVLPLTLAVPFDTQFNKVNWGLMFFIEYLYGYICLGSILYQDAMFCFFIIHSTGHLEILINDIRGLVALKDELINNNEKRIGKKSDYTANGKSCVTYSDAEAYIYSKLKDCVVHHQLIISFIEKVQTAFGIVIATNFFYNLLVICLLGFQLTATNIETVIQFGLFFVGAVVQLIVICVYCDRFTNMSLQVAQELYCCDWPSMSPRAKSSIIFMLARAQRPLNISALGFTDASIETMASILKTSFSYYTILKTLEE